jgi:hypothetical protein
MITSPSDPDAVADHPQEYRGGRNSLTRRRSEGLCEAMSHYDRRR